MDKRRIGFYLPYRPDYLGEYHVCNPAYGFLCQLVKSKIWREYKPGRKLETYKVLWLN